MEKLRLDQALVSKGKVATRSQAESYIKLGKVKVDGRVVSKPGHFVAADAELSIDQDIQYVSRAALKLASAVEALSLDFKNKVVLDVGSSTGGFTDYALKHGAAKVIAVDVGSNQLHPSLRVDKKVELHESTDIRDFPQPAEKIDIVLVDVSFISLRKVLPSIVQLIDRQGEIVAMCKPQFEASENELNRGVVKNDTLRRKILNDFENWVKRLFKIEAKADSKVSGTKGNLERFYLLHLKT